MKTKTPTLNAGASKERDAILAYVRRKKNTFDPTYSNYKVLADVEEWLLTRKKRYDARPGGLGRGRKAK